ncbi:solute carrier family 23 protein [Lactobacillaceae bacterium 24-114]
MDEKATLLIGPDEKVPTKEAVFLGLQHVLAMDVYVPPIILAGLLAMGSADSTGLLQATFLACGIGTILQTRYFMKMPVSQGPSFIPLTAAAGVVLASGGIHGGGMATLMGALLVGAILMILLGLTGVFHKIINRLVPAVVGGTIITCVGLSLIPSALNDNIFEAQGNVYQNIELASITAVILMVCIAISIRFPRLQKLFKTGSIVIALIAGTAVSAAMGRFDASTIASAPWFSLPQRTIFHWGVHFDLTSIFTFIIIYAILTTETTGTWFAMGAVTNHEITPKQWNRGIIGEGVSCLVATITGTTPVTGYSTNAGVISITGVASKTVFIAAGIWFMILGFCTKLSAFLAAIPSPVIGGVFAIITVTIMLNGLNVIRNLKVRESDLYIIGLPIVITIALVLIPDKIVKGSPLMLQYLLGSPVAMAALTAIVLNLLMPREAKI